MGQDNYKALFVFPAEQGCSKSIDIQPGGKSNNNFNITHSSVPRMFFLLFCPFGPFQNTFPIHAIFREELWNLYFELFHGFYLRELNCVPDSASPNLFMKSVNILTTKLKVLMCVLMVHLFPSPLPGTCSQTKFIISYQAAWFGVIDKDSGNTRVMQIKKKWASISDTQNIQHGQHDLKIKQVNRKYSATLRKYFMLRCSALVTQ